MKKLLLGYDALGRKVYLEDEDRDVHMHILGGPGTGKSKFIEWMIREDIRRGAGLCLLDPHGKLYDDLVEWCAYLGIGSDRDYRELILLNPSKGDQIIGFNPFISDGGDLSVQVDRIVHAILKSWGQASTDHTPTLGRTLRLVCAVMLDQQVSLPEVRHLLNFEAREIRDHLVDKLRNPFIQDEWKELQTLKRASDWRGEMLSTRNRLFPFLASETIARFMGLADRSLNLSEIMEQSKILLVNLKEAGDRFSDDNRRLFGTLLLSKLFDAAKRRPIPPGQSSPRPFYVYIDEFQKFLTPDIPHIIAEGRKMGLHLILSHQFLTQLREQDDQVYDAVLSCDIKAIFGGGPRQDALTMVDEMFVNQLDLKQIKKAIYHTTHINQYVRDQVRTKSRGTSHTHSTNRSESIGDADTKGSDSSTTYGNSTMRSTNHPDSVGWFPQNASHTNADTHSSAVKRGTTHTDTHTQNKTEGESESEAESESSSVADVPFIMPIPKQELGSLEYWSLDEQRWRMSDALKIKLQRHLWLKLRDTKTQPLTVPDVQRWAVAPETIEEHERQLAGAQDALTPAEADLLLKSQEDALLKEVKASRRKYSVNPVLQ